MKKFTKRPKSTSASCIDATVSEHKYILKHGFGPGTLPKDVDILDYEDDDYYNTIVWLDRELTPEELDKYEIVEAVDEITAAIVAGNYAQPQYEVRWVPIVDEYESEYDIDPTDMIESIGLFFNIKDAEEYAKMMNQYGSRPGFFCEVSYIGQ